MVGGAVAWAAVGVAGGAAVSIGPLAVCLVWGGAAALAGLALGLRRWWLPLQVAAPLLVWLVLQWHAPAWVFPVAALGLAAVYWNAVGEGVPLYLSNPTTWRALAALLPEHRPCRYVDLGSGLGGGLFHMAAARPDCRFTGVETAPLVYAVARMRLALGRLPNVTLAYRSLWGVDLGEFDVVYCFLSPKPMARLYDKAKTEMRPGSLLVSNSFAVPGVEPDETRVLDDRRRTRLLIWRF